VKILTVRVPEALAADIESESRAAGSSKSDIVRRRLEGAPPSRSRDRKRASFFELAADLIGSVHDETMPRDLSTRRKSYLRKWGYGKSGHR
jgi:Ribbon-helix-helix protein, copG family